MKRFLKNVTYAINGLLSALKTERNLRIDIAAMLVAIAFGFYLKLSIITWGLIILVISFVLVVELFNTAIERLGDVAAHAFLAEKEQLSGCHRTVESYSRKS